MRKVVHLITRLDLGGAQQNTLHTVLNLDRSVYEPVLVCGRGDLDSEAPEGTIFVESLRREVDPFYDLLALLELTKLLLAEKPDILHTHSSKAGILGRLGGRMAGVNVIVHTYHGFGFHDRQHPVVKSLYVALERLCARVSDALVFVSRANIAYAAAHGLVKPEAAILIRSGVRLDALPAKIDAAKLKTSAGIGMHKRLVVSIGNLKPQKNAADFVTAAAAVLAKAPEARFVFIGDGPQRKALEAKAFALGLNDRLFFLGWRRDAAAWLAAADVFAMTSLWEGLPRALVEAMKSGVPPVCYATDGVADLVADGRTGLSVAPGDAAALAAGIVRLLGDEPLRARLGAAAAAAIGPEFDIDGMVRSQEALYDRLLAR
ncbi:MAG: glycosyltransferase [Elusimicrobiota bacterium]|nr:MAG: glycosyltransferase [Elusimicrobiota bacterium]